MSVDKTIKKAKQKDKVNKKFDILMFLLAFLLLVSAYFLYINGNKKTAATLSDLEETQIEYDIYNYIKCDTCTDWFVTEDRELHIIANEGNEYIFK